MTASEPASEPVAVAIPTLRRLIATDLPFVLNTWKRCLRELPEFRNVSNAVYFPWVSARMDRALRDAGTEVHVLCLSDAPEFVCGFVIARAGGVLWLYVLKSLRKAGHGRTLMEATGWLPGATLRLAHPPTALRLPSWARSGTVQFDPCIWPA